MFKQEVNKIFVCKVFDMDHKDVDIELAVS